MAKIIVSDIEWDTDGEKVKLPKTVEIESPTSEMVADARRGGFCDDIAEFLSDKFGWCVGGFAAKVEDSPPPGGN